MGSFIVNYQIRGDAIEPVQATLQLQDIQRAYVTHAKNNWISVYESRASFQDEAWVSKLARTLSRQLKTTVVAFLVHDSDVFKYFLFDQGMKQDEYDSCPEYFGKSSPRGEQTLGNPSELLKHCRPGVSIEDVVRVLDRSRGPGFADEQLEQLARLLGIDDTRAATDFCDIGNDVSPDELDAILVTGEDQDEVEENEVVEEDNDWEPPKTPMAKAIKVGNLEQIAKFIDNGKDINAIDWLTQTPLGLASKWCRLDVMRKLIELGADVNARNAVGMSPLYMAVEHEAAIQLLIDAGADPNAPADEVGSPLHYAITSRDPKLVRMLIDAGADVNVRDQNGLTPLALHEKLNAQFNSAFPMPSTESLTDFMTDAVALAENFGLPFGVAQVEHPVDSDQRQRDLTNEMQLAMERLSKIKENSAKQDSEIVELLRAAGGHQ